MTQSMPDLDFSQAFREGTLLLHRGRAAEATPLLERAYALEPTHVDAAINLGGAYILTKKFKRAVEILEPLSERAPQHAEVWINLGAAYLGNPVLARDAEQRRAITAFKRALALDPVAPSVAYNIGLIYRDRREYATAIEWFRQALQHNPQDQDARRILARLSQKRRRDEEE